MLQLCDFTCHLKTLAGMGIDTTQMRIALFARDPALFDQACQQVKQAANYQDKMREELVLMKTKLFLMT